MRYFTILIILIAFSNSLQGQKLDSIYYPLIENISTLRTIVLQKDIEALYQFDSTIKRWSTIEPNDEHLGTFMFQVEYCIAFLNWDLKKVRKEFEDLEYGKRLAPLVTNEELQSLCDNSFLNQLIRYGILKRDYPFPINHEGVIHEIEFLDLEKGMKIADVGAGRGIFSILLALTKLDLTIYINEINDDLLDSIEEVLSTYFQNYHSIYLVKGSKKNANLPSGIDRVFIRNSFHHFSKKKQMLNSIKKSLNDDGLLIIHEALKSEEPKDECSKKMDEASLRKEMAKYDFVLIDEMRKGQVIVLKYRNPTKER